MMPVISAGLRFIASMAAGVQPSFLPSAARQTSCTGLLGHCVSPQVSPSSPVRSREHDDCFRRISANRLDAPTVGNGILYRKSGEDSSCLKRKKPRQARSRAGVSSEVICGFPVRERDILTPRPHRSADRQGEGVRLLLSPRRGPQPSSYDPGTPSFLQRGHPGRPSRPRPASRRRVLGSRSRHLEPSRRHRRSCRSRLNTSPDRSLAAFRPACTAAMTPCGRAIRRSSRPTHRAVS